MGLARPTVREIYFSDQASSMRSPVEQDQYERNFFNRVRLQSEISKHTYSRRLDDLNLAFNPLLPQYGRVELMDIGISSGITTQEWMDSLRSAGIDFHMVAGDRNINAYLLSVCQNIEVLVERSGYPIHFDVFGKGIEISHITFIPSPAIRFIKSSIARVVSLNGLNACTSSDAGENVGRLGLRCIPIKLVSPRLQEDVRIDLIEDDILSDDHSELKGRFHAIRAANILNKAYFGQDEIRKTLINLRQRLRDGGLLAVCRTHVTNENHATIFSVGKDRKFQVLKRIGEGSEIEDDALSLNY